jgi:hypothetical protein
MKRVPSSLNMKKSSNGIALGKGGKLVVDAMEPRANQVDG